MVLKGYSYFGITEDSMSFKNLPENTFEIPVGTHVGAFGVKRKYHTHEGIDLYCKDGTEVLSLTDGIIIDKGWFTGTLAGSSWWRDTQYVSIQTDNYVFVYGEIISSLNIGDRVFIGDTIGNVKEVLIKNKGRPKSMLHLEVYESKFYTSPKEWINERPLGLIDPLVVLRDLIKESKKE